MENKKDNFLTLPVAIVVAAIIIGGALFFRNNGPTKEIFKTPARTASSGTQAASNGEIIIPPVLTSEHILGNPNAPVVIVEYSDPECPFCKRFHDTMHVIIDEYGKDGKVAWVYRNMPIDSLHTKARHEAGAAECAGALGGNDKYWQYLDKIFEITPSNNGLDPNELPIIAGQIGLDGKKFADCLSADTYAPKIEKEYEDGVKAGADGTPYSIVLTKDGQKIPIMGAQPLEQVKSTIDKALSQPAKN